MAMTAGWPTLAFLPGVFRLIDGAGWTSVKHFCHIAALADVRA
jgi:hypothetical protein